MDDKEAYKIAIEAYWHHVGRYHTWMNYYGLFEGALLVAFCTLLCATNIIVGGVGAYTDTNTNMSLQGGGVYLDNNYATLQYIVTILGIFTSIFWLLSINGHRAWKNNWMNIIEYYECEAKPIYKLVILDGKYYPRNKAGISISKGIIPKGYSTDIITILFVHMVILSWIFAFFYVLGWKNCYCYAMVFLIYLMIAFFFHFCSTVLIKGIYSDISRKKVQYKYP